MKRAALLLMSIVLLLPVCVGGPRAAMKDSPGGKMKNQQGGLNLGNREIEEHHQSDNDQDVSGHHNLVFSFNGEEASYVGAAILFLIGTNILACRRVRRSEWSLNTTIDAIQRAKENGGAEVAEAIINDVKSQAAERSPIHSYVKKRKGRR